MRMSAIHIMLIMELTFFPPLRRYDRFSSKGPQFVVGEVVSGALEAGAERAGERFPPSVDVPYERETGIVLLLLRQAHRGGRRMFFVSDEHAARVS